MQAINSNGIMQPQTTNILNGFSYQKAALTNLANNQKSSNQSPQKAGGSLVGTSG